MSASIPTVLYVDNNMKFRSVLGSVLRDWGFEVIATADPRQAIRQFRKLRFEVALIHYQLPVISGPELARKMKAIDPDVPVVMLSECAVLPDLELLWLDAHFGPDASLDDLPHILRTLSCPPALKQDKAAAARWAEST